MAPISVTEKFAIPLDKESTLVQAEHCKNASESLTSRKNENQNNIYNFALFFDDPVSITLLRK